MKERIYFGRPQVRNNEEGDYLCIHAYGCDLQGERTCEGMSLDHLAGYIEGAAMGAFKRVDLSNGIPENRASAFAERTRPLSRDEVSELLDRARLTDFYTDVVP